MSWETVFMPSTPVIELVVRGTVIYLTIFVLMRVIGRREAGQLGVADLTMVVIIAEAANSGLVGSATSILDSVILIVVVMLWALIIDAASYRWKWVARLSKPRPRTLIRDGDIDDRTTLREFMTREEVMTQLRLHGVQDISDVHKADIEPNGMISIVTRDEEK